MKCLVQIRNKEMSTEVELNANSKSRSENLRVPCTEAGTIRFVEIDSTSADAATDYLCDKGKTAGFCS